MKRIVFILTFTLMFCAESFGQKLSLNDLINLCNKENWEHVNQTLLSKGWTYYDSEKGDTYKYNTITWSFNKDYYSDKAQGWFYLFTYEGFPNKVSYTVLNKGSYAFIQNSISSAGFRLLNSVIEDNQVVSIYGNASYSLEISTEKRNDDDWSGTSLTAYNITLIKKAGIYDPDNGKKTEYYYDDAVKAEYTLSNGKLNGQLKSYTPDGKLERIGNYSNGIENGIFKEYDEYGNLEVEYTMANGSLKGVLKTYYTDGQIKMSSNYLNGKKHGNFKEYNEHGNLEAEYTMTSDSLNGVFKTYYSNGNIKMSGNYLNGKQHGNFTEYDEYGNKDAEYVMSKGKKNGVLKFYENGHISYSTTYFNDLKNGQHSSFFYDDSNTLFLKVSGDYLNNEKNGSWNTIYLEEGKERVLSFENYTDGIKNGAFQQTQGDSLIVGNYLNDELSGDYKLYVDFSSMLLGGLLRTNISDLTLIAEGGYYKGVENGYWKFYDLTGTLRREGRYSNGLEIGEWKYYYAKRSGEKGDSIPYSNSLFLIENYNNGQRNGKSIRYSYIEEEKFPCSEIDVTKSTIDTCKRFIYHKVLETTFYKDNKLNGSFELRDSTNSVVAKGNYKNDLKDGEWLERFSDKDINNKTYFIYEKGNYINDNREGRWIQYFQEDKITKTFNYKNGELNGEYIDWNNLSNPQEKKQFDNGKLKELITYDSLGLNPKNKYQIYDEKYDSYKCRKTEYLDGGYAVQEYYLKKENEINHNWFVFTFSLSTGKLSDGTQGYKDGEFKLYNSDNKPLVSGAYYKQDRIGLWTFYYYDQLVKIQSNFANDIQTDEKYLKLNGDLFSGEFTYINENEGIQQIRSVKDGLRNGKTVYIDLKTKKVVKKESYKNGELK